MAHYCVKQEKKDCEWRFRGNVVGTKKSLCTCYSKTKPCQEEPEKCQKK